MRWRPQPGRAHRLTGLLANSAHGFDSQLVQTRYRLSLVDQWPISAGSRVLEVGCGQGDMTVVLADAVGPTGHVTAVDSADADYGSPTNLGEAAGFLRAGPLGGQLDIQLGVDLLDPATEYPPDSFDYAVLAHCAWYFASVEQLRATLARIRPWASRLLLAEWSLTPHAMEQVPHLLAVLIQGQLEAAGTASGGNVRTPVSVATMRRIVTAAGWRITELAPTRTRHLQDADWEIALALGVAEIADAPPRVKAFAAQQVELLLALRGNRGNRPLPGYRLLAERAD